MGLRCLIEEIFCRVWVIVYERILWCNKRGSPQQGRQLTSLHKGGSPDPTGVNPFCCTTKFFPKDVKFNNGGDSSCLQIDALGKDRMSLITSREGFKLLSGARAWLEPTNKSSQIVIFSVPRYPTAKRKAHNVGETLKRGIMAMGLDGTNSELLENPQITNRY